MKTSEKKLLLAIIAAVFVLGVVIYFTVSVTPEKTILKTSNFYRAAVLEVVPYRNLSLSINEVIKKNLDTFHRAAIIAKNEEVDIIVFPESILYFDIDEFINNRSLLIDTIANDIPNPENTLMEYNPCNQHEIFQNLSLLRNLSCMAKTYEMFIVANLVDYKECKNGRKSKIDLNTTSNCFDNSKCHQEGFYLYNTNVVFDRKGRFITRYYKKHLYMEPLMKTTTCPDSGNFETDFGNFTTVICFDILFNEIVKVLQNGTIRNMALPLYWFDHTPFVFFAPILQQAFAYYYGINILTSDGHTPGTGSIGSGILSGKNGALISTNQPDGKTKLLISNVPKHPKNYTLKPEELHRKRYHFENGAFLSVPIQDSMTFEDECDMNVRGPPKDLTKDYRCHPSSNLTEYTFKKLERREDSIILCSGTFCCSLTYKTQSMEEDYYLAITAEEFKLYGLIHFESESCFFAHCKSKNGHRCSSFKMKSKTVFQNVILVGNFTRKYIFPFAIDSNVRLTSINKWNYDGRSRIVYKNSADNSSLLFLGLFGRDDDLG